MVETGIVNALLQGIVTGGIIAAGALGLSLVYSIAEVPNFAHGDMLTVGAYLALALNNPSELPLVPSTLVLPFALAAVGGVLLAGVFGGVYEKVVFKQFRGKDADLITMVIVSLGLALVLRNLVLFLVGSKNVTYDTVSRVDFNADLYLTGQGVAVEINQRAGGALQTLDAWGYGWPVVVAILLVAVAVGVAVYRWRTGDQGSRRSTSSARGSGASPAAPSRSWRPPCSPAAHRWPSPTPSPARASATAGSSASSSP
jgi:neutral amino acid transport system permease protein